jgi:hypothetical protein
VIAGTQVVPKESNEWQRRPAADVFGLYAARHQRPASTADESVSDTTDHGDGDDAERRVDRALHEFVRRHATREGYGGWKSVYRRFATRNTQHATRNTQHATRNTQHATRNTQHATRNTQHATMTVVLGQVA